MDNKKEITVARMKNGQHGTVVRIEGGQSLTDRLNALGIRQSKKITRVGAMMMRGPVTVKVDGCQVAMGYGMAGKVVVELS